MENTEWLKMLEYRQTVNHLSRNILHRQKECTLNISELEILSLLYLSPNDSTPLGLSEKSGMKKEAVSRLIKQLFEKGYLNKEKNPQDERSYSLSITQTGLNKLNENYISILKPVYELKRKMGKDFELLLSLMQKADSMLKESENEGE